MAQNDLEKTLAKVIDQKITPEFKKINEKFEKVDIRLKNIERKLDATMEMTAKNSEDIVMLREDFTDNGFTLERIETKLDATVRRQNDSSVKTSQLQRRVLKLESKVAR